MKLFIDSADISKIKTILEYYPVAGFTTNPAILANEAKDAKLTMKAFKELVTPERIIHMQVTAQDSEGMVDQAKRLTDYFGPTFHIKIPVTSEGICAVMKCKQAGLHVTVTAVFTAAQALMAADAGADYVAPYVNRIDNIEADGVGTVGKIVDIFRQHRFPTKVIAASFKNVAQVVGVAAAGAQAATITPEMFDSLIFHPYTSQSLEGFQLAWTERFQNCQISGLV